MVNKFSIILGCLLLVFLVKAVPVKASIFAADIGAVVLSTEETTSYDANADNSSELKFKQKSATGFVIRSKELIFGIGVLSHHVKMKQENIEEFGIAESPTHEINTAFFELLFHVPIPFIPLTLSANTGVGGRTLLLKSAVDGEKSASTSSAVTKTGFDIGGEFGNNFVSFRFSLGYHMVRGDTVFLKVEKQYPNFEIFEAKFNPNVTFYTLSIGVGLF